MEHVPTATLKSNAVYFKLGILAYNLTIAVKRLVLKDAWITKTISTIRWQLIFISGKIVNHGRQLFLKTTKHFYEFFLGLRNNIRFAFKLLT